MYTVVCHVSPTTRTTVPERCRRTVRTVPTNVARTVPAVLLLLLLLKCIKSLWLRPAMHFIKSLHSTLTSAHMV